MSVWNARKTTTTVECMISAIMSEYTLDSNHSLLDTLDDVGFHMDLLYMKIVYTKSLGLFQIAFEGKPSFLWVSAMPRRNLCPLRCDSMTLGFHGLISVYSRLD
jgi:hypothetical protein